MVIPEAFADVIRTFNSLLRDQEAERRRVEAFKNMRFQFSLARSVSNLSFRYRKTDCGFFQFSLARSAVYGTSTRIDFRNFQFSLARSGAAQTSLFTWLIPGFQFSLARSVVRTPRPGVHVYFLSILSCEISGRML